MPAHFVSCHCRRIVQLSVARLEKGNLITTISNWRAGITSYIGKTERRNPKWKLAERGTTYIKHWTHLLPKHKLKKSALHILCILLEWLYTQKVLLCAASLLSKFKLFQVSYFYILHIECNQGQDSSVLLCGCHEGHSKTDLLQQNSSRRLLLLLQYQLYSQNFSSSQCAYIVKL